MFGFFDDPFKRRYRPRYVVRAYDPFFGYYHRPVQRNYDPFGINSLGAYMHAMDQAFNQMFDYNQEEEEYPEQQKLNKEQKSEEKKEESEKEESKKEEPKKEIKVSQKGEQKPQYWARSSVFSSHSRGGIEEIREKTYDSQTGETIESQTRRIGDRWCRIDTTTDKEGSSKSKETWHNVGDDEMEAFKKEWVDRRGLKLQKQEQKSIKSEEKPVEKKEDKTEVDEKTD